ncbi:MAG: inositol monophosphatase family protein [Candidatus Woesebacteria bacterium]|nr:inositol monophosphatase family protein [Candidatus Woesebacteria bacterium]
MTDIKELFSTAEEIADEVSMFLQDNFGSKKEMTHKTDSHYGIDDDIKCNEMYESYLKINTPQIALFTEEGEQNLNSEYVWVVDPIEGTSNYRAGNPFFATVIALLHNNEPVLSIVNAPILKQKFYAIQNKGAYLNGNKISPTKLDELDKALVDFGRGMKKIDKEWYVRTISKLNNHIRTNRTFGACGLDICYCAAGITDVYINSGSQIYDYLAGAFISKEAGAEVLNFMGNNWTISDKDFLVSNKTLSNAIIKLL